MVLLARFCSSLHYNSDDSYLFVSKTKIHNFKADNGGVNFATQFCLGSISNKFTNVEPEDSSFKRNAYDFSANYDAIDKSDISNIHKYLMVKNNIK